ncbi:response regulator [Sphingosinicella xenopeptidilytica]|uniref:Response regulator n=1 Tax=Sphingosinicella xenopeptidilytica TaxID=364098 RepID=A0ABW3C1Y6_SPHXN|nr:response regulator [Sphingosinicella sp.]
MTAEVILVDDERLVAKLYGRAVEAAGYQATLFGDAESAFKRIAQQEPALLVTDLNMPGLSGYALAERIMERGLKHFPIILMSADDTAELIKAGVASGIDDFLVKGVGFDRFRARLDHWMKGPFHGLPAHVRVAARESLARSGAPETPISHLHGSLDRITARTAVTVEDLLDAVGGEYGRSAAEALRLLGVIDGVLALLARSNGLAQLRRLEAMAGVVDRLGDPWQARLRPYIDRFETVAQDATFRHAAQSLRLR